MPRIRQFFTFKTFCSYLSKCFKAQHRLVRDDMQLYARRVEALWHAELLLYLIEHGESDDQLLQSVLGAVPCLPPGDESTVAHLVKALLVRIEGSREDKDRQGLYGNIIRRLEQGALKPSLQNESSCRMSLAQPSEQNSHLLPRRAQQQARYAHYHQLCPINPSFRLPLESDWLYGLLAELRSVKARPKDPTALLEAARAGLQFARWLEESKVRTPTIVDTLA